MEITKGNKLTVGGALAVAGIAVAAVIVANSLSKRVKFVSTVMQGV